MSTHLKLSDVCEITMGQAPSGNTYNDKGEGLPLIAGAGDFGDTHPKVKKFTTEASKVCNDRDIVLGIRATIGEKVIADGRYCLGRGVAGLRAGPQLNERYLWHWLTHINPILISKARGATFLQVNRADIAELPIRLPPIAEQRRIAAILDKADTLRTKRREALAQLDRLAQSIFVEMFGDPVTNPKGWPKHSLRELASRIQIGPFGSQLHEEDYIEGGTPLVNPTHIQQGRIKPDMSLTVPDGKYAQLEQYHLSKGDLILGRRGEMGRCAVVSDREQGWLCGTGSLFVRPNYSLLSSEYLKATISSPQMRRYMENVSQGVTMANLNKEIVGALPIMLPPKELQELYFNRISSAIEVMNRFRLTETVQQELFLSLQHRAFRGEL